MSFAFNNHNEITILLNLKLHYIFLLDISFWFLVLQKCELIFYQILFNLQDSLIFKICLLNLIVFLHNLIYLQYYFCPFSFSKIDTFFIFRYENNWIHTTLSLLLIFHLLFFLIYFLTIINWYWFHFLY